LFREDKFHPTVCKAGIDAGRDAAGMVFHHLSCYPHVPKDHGERTMFRCLSTPAAGSPVFHGNGPTLLVIDNPQDSPDNYYYYLFLLKYLLKK
jgi:hypothetical protein